MQLFAMMMLLVAGAMASEDHASHDHGHGTKQECSCAQAEPDHPFKIDCDDKATIDAAMLTLESDACEKPRPADAFEWAGTFETPANSFKWVSQAATGTAGAETYADAEMKMVVISVDKTDVAHLFEKASIANTLMAGNCPPKNTGDSIPAPTAAGACYTLTFPTTNPSTTDFHLTIATTGVAHVAFYTAHMPTEFERDTHYLMDDGMSVADMAYATAGGVVGTCEGVGCATKGPVEPNAQNKEFCKIQYVDDLMVCQQAFFIIQAHHDYCRHDTLSSYQEKLFHDWESKCNGCLIRRKYDPNLLTCPPIKCTETTVATLSYNYLNNNCVAADTDYAFEWAGVFDTPKNAYKWVAQAKKGTAGAETYADPEMKMVVYAMTGTEQSKLFNNKKAADTLMNNGPCPPKITGDSIPAPTAAGACYTLTFPTTDPSTTDFHLTIATTGVAHVAFYTAHMPIEFERDTHYLMSEGMTAAEMKTATTDVTVATDTVPGVVEPADELGGPAAHDHGRRLSVATNGAKGVENRKSIGKRRLANSGSCCTDGPQQGAWKQVVSYHDLCEHDQVPTTIEKGFHDYEASCEDFFCNLIGPDVDQTVCPYAPLSPPPLPSLPPSPPPLPSLPPSPSSPVVTESTGIEEGTLIGVIVAAVVVALILLAGVACLVAKEKAGKPLFTSLDAPASNA